MGIAKRMWEEEMERGYSTVQDTYVCTGCFGDEGLKKFVRQNSQLGKCSYCKRRRRVCHLNQLIEHIMTSVRLEWGHPANEGLPYETKEGGWQFGEVYSTWELLDELDLQCSSDQLINDISDAIHDSEWCEVDPYSLPLDRTLVYGWERFCKFITHTARFVFFRAENTEHNQNQHDEMNPVDILEAIGGICNHLRLVKSIAASRKIYRVRVVDQNVSLKTAKELGSPPDHLAIMPNRMSPVGISMFYGAFNIDTAISETFLFSTNENKKAACGEFSPTRELVVIDLSQIFYVPSLFDPDEQHLRSYYKFMCDFITDFSKPIERGERAHAEYVPTQVVTEFFRHVYRNEDGTGVDGVIYPSSKTGEQAIVIFADSLACVDAPEVKLPGALLKLNKVKEIDLREYSSRRNNDLDDEIFGGLLK
ncbi:MAG: HEPN-associated N-terminal domain-containing protein [Pseudomonadaceae bacterium]